MKQIAKNSKVIIHASVLMELKVIAQAHSGKDKNNCIICKFLINNNLKSNYLLESIKLDVSYLDINRTDNVVIDGRNKLILKNTGLEMLEVVQVPFPNGFVTGECVLVNQKNKQKKEYNIPGFLFGDVKKRLC